MAAYPRKWLLCGARPIVLLLVLSTVALAQEPRRVLGSVRTAEDMPVKHTNVRIIEGVDTDATSESGEFSFRLSPRLKVGYPVTFLVTGWVIVDPCIMSRGRTYLPDPNAEAIALKVLQPGDKRLSSVESIGCIIREKVSRYESKASRFGSKASRFEPKGPPPKAGPSTVLIEPSPLFVGEGSRERREWKSNPRERGAQVVVASFHETFSRSPLEQSESKPKQSVETLPAQPIMDDFLITRGKALGLTGEQLRAAVDDWIKSSKDVYQKGLVAFYRGRYAEARGFFAASIKDSGKDALERYVSLGRAEYEMGNYPAAESALRKVLAVHNEDPIVMTDLGLVLDAEAKFSEAESYHNQSLAIDEESAGPDHPDMARVLSNLADLYTTTGKYAQAEAAYTRALAINEKSLGSDHPDSVKLRAYLALLYFNQGKPNEAEASIKQALVIEEMAVGSRHPDVAGMLFALAALYQTLGKDRKAKPLYESALDIATASVGPNHPDLAQILIGLATIEQKRGKFKRAAPLYRRALTLAKSLGPEHPGVADVLDCMARFYLDQGAFALAEPLYKEALAIDEKALGSDHPDVASILTTWAFAYELQAEYARAEPLLRRALAIQEKALGPGAPRVAEITEALASCLHGLGRDREARVFEKQTAEIHTREKQQIIPPERSKDQAP